jgi:protein MpaA
VLRPTYQELVTHWKALRAREDMHVREVACVGAPRTLLCADLGDQTLPGVALCAGVHGDEPAGPLALLRLVETEMLDRRYAYRIWVCANPTGFEAGTRCNADGIDINRSFGRGGGSPEARAILTANRDRKVVLSLDLHEDRDAAGFYCYEYGGESIGRAVIGALERRGYAPDPLDTLDVGGPLVDAIAHREPGRVSADPRAEAIAVGALSYSLLLARNAADRALTLETPASLPLDIRVTMHCEAVVAALAALSQALHK